MFVPYAPCLSLPKPEILLGPDFLSSFPQLTYLHVRSVAHHHYANGDLFLLTRIGQFLPLHLALVEMAYLVQFPEQVG